MVGIEIVLKNREEIELAQRNGLASPPFLYEYYEMFFVLDMISVAEERDGVVYLLIDGKEFWMVYDPLNWEKIKYHMRDL
jgi:hypothetical protein